MEDAVHLELVDDEAEAPIGVDHDHRKRWYARLTTVSTELRDRYVTYGDILVAEKRAKAEHYAHSQVDGHQAREREASILALDISCQAIEAVQEIRALEEERDNLRFLIDHTTSRR